MAPGDENEDEDSDYNPSSIGTDDSDEECSDLGAEEFPAKYLFGRFQVNRRIQIILSLVLPHPILAIMLLHHLKITTLQIFPSRMLGKKIGSSAHQFLRRPSRTVLYKLLLPNCRMKYKTKILPNTRDAIFKGYWELANRDRRVRRVSFVASLIEFIWTHSFQNENDRSRK